MNILWDDSVYPFIEISEVIKPPHRISDSFIEAVKMMIDKSFPANLRKDDGTKILIIEKDTAIMSDRFFAHVDQVSRQLFDLSSIQERFCGQFLPSNSTNKYLRSKIVFDVSLILIHFVIYKRLYWIRTLSLSMLAQLFYLSLFSSQHQLLSIIDSFIIVKKD